MKNTFDLRDFSLKLLCQWKLILLIPVIFAVLAGGWSILTQISSLRTPVPETEASNANEEQNLMYSPDMVEKFYDQQIDNLQRKISREEFNLKQLYDYAEKSILMTIDPYRKPVAVITMYIDTGYQIIPQSIYQNPDIGKVIALAYASLLEEDALFQKMLEGLPEKQEISFFKELVHRTISDSILTIYITGADATQCAKMSDEVALYLESKQPEISAKIGEHTLIIIGESVQNTVDLSLLEKQASLKNNINATATALQGAQAELLNKFNEIDKWRTENPKKAEVAPPQQGSNTDEPRSILLKSVLLYCVMGFVGGACLSIIVIFFMDLIDPRISFPKDIKKDLSLRYLGGFAKEKLRGK